VSAGPREPRGLARGAAVPALVLAVGLVHTACGGPPEPGGRAQLEAFHADLTEVLARLPIPGLSVAVSRDGEVVWAHGYGVADAETGREATASTPYRIASLTKPLASAVVLHLAASGALALDDSVARYLEDPPPWTREVTVRHVLSHTSEGSEPGQRYTYSGRYDILADAAEGAAGQPFPVLLDSLVFGPAGMEHTAAVARLGDHAPLGDSMARSHDPEGAVWEGTLPRVTTAGNGVVSTVGDLARFVDAFSAGRLVPPDRVEEAWTPAAVEGGRGPYGLGWFVEDTPVGRVVWHGGQWPGYSGLLLHVPGGGLTLTVLANAWGVSHPYYGIGTGTALYNAIAASFLHHVVLERGAGPGPVPDMPWDAAPEDLRRSGAGLDPSARYFWGAELFGRGLLHREAGDPDRGDALMAAAVACCPRALDASQDLGLLFHLGRSQDSTLRRIGTEAGERRLARYPDDVVTRFNLAVAYRTGGEDDRATPLLQALLDDPAAPVWILGWAAYLRAEQLIDEDPVRARALLEGVLRRGVDESGLLGEARRLLGEIGG
jgi:CubicO group peptidase (beta-lactamase class C family)